ncbi:MAG: uroporphyrinogen-III C-methyltransferase [Sedimentisphaerales bacterium]|nr:uroporphyrinogen-III C-methyltransferase [Sedimentisphaerales bacterium]
MKKGKVYLVGAGPGDETLITLRAIQVLGLADCVIYDGLANESLLRYAPIEAEKVGVRKRTGPRPWTQSEIDALLLDKAKEGKIVVRLKGGDPGLFGRAPEEAALCAQEEIPFEIVPGITAGLAAAAYAGIFLTDRDHASQVVFVTGREAATKTEATLDYRFLSGFDGTIVLYMAMGNLDQITSHLIDGGKNPATPVAVIQNATTPRQRLLKSQLDLVAMECREKDFGAPSIVIIGPTAVGNDPFNWFMNRALFGKHIVIARDPAGNDVLAEKLAAAGAIPIRFNAVRIIDQSDSPPTQEAISRLSEYDWIMFTSANGVRHAFKALYSAGRDARAFGKAKVACIGKQTADILESFGIRADFVPAKYTSEIMAKELCSLESLKGKRIVLLRSGIAPKDLVETFTAVGAQVDDVAVYTVEPNRENIEEIREQIQARGIDWLTFTSSSTVRSFLDQIPVSLVREAGLKIGSIGPVATKQLKALGLEPTLEADVHTIDGLLAAIEQYEENHRDSQVSKKR